MEQKGAFNPSRCEIISAEIAKFGNAIGHKENANLRAMITSFQISQSVNNSALSGTLEVYDSIGLLEEMPIRGEETLNLVIRSYDMQTEIDLDCHVYKVDDVNISDDQSGLAYTLHWVTKTSFEASKRSFITAYINETASSIVEKIFTKYYHKDEKLAPYINYSTREKKFPPGTLKYNLKNSPGRHLIIEKTEELMQLTIPDMTPAQAIQFVARRTFGKEPNAGSSFRFFETYDGYYFVSDEWLYLYGADNPIATFNYAAFISLDPDDSYEQITGFSQFGNPLRVDVGNEMASGAYNVTIVEVDILKRTHKRHNYNYRENFLPKFKDITGQSASIKNDRHSEDFIKETFTDENARQYMIIRDYKDDNSSKAFRAETNFRNLAAQRTFYKNHAQATSVIGVTEGRLEVSAGDIVRVNTSAKNVSTDKTENPQLSGRFLVTNVENDVSNGILKTVLQMFKYDWSDAGKDTGKRATKKVEVLRSGR